MLRNNLAVLLAERQIKITRIAKDTDISRSTITSIAQNDTKMIQLEVINKLCMHLNIEPKDFFVYVPIDIEFNIIFDFGAVDFEVDEGGNEESPLIRINGFSFDLFVDVTNRSEYEATKTYEVKGVLKNIKIDESLYPLSKPEMDINLFFADEKKDNKSDDASDFKYTVLNNLDPTFKLTLQNELTNTIRDELTTKLVDFYKDSIYPEKLHKPTSVWFKDFYGNSKIRIIKNII